MNTNHNQQKQQQESLRLIPPQHLPLHPLKLPHHRLPPPLTPHPHIRHEILRTRQEPFRIPCPRIHIYRPPLHLLELKRPQQLRHSEPQVAFREMDAGTHAAAAAVAVMVAGGVIRGCGVVWGEERLVGVAGGVEDGWVGCESGVVVEAPGVEDDGGVGWDMHAVNCVG